MTPDEPALLDSSFPLALEAPFTLRMALAAGLRKKQLGALVATGYLRRPVHGVYVATQVPDSIPLRAWSLSLVVPSGCFVCDRTAAWLHGAPAALAPGEHLLVPRISCFRPADAGRLRNRLAVSGERTVLPDDLTEVHGVLATRPLRTAYDLGRLQGNRDIALAGMDALLRLGLFGAEELVAGVEQFAKQRGVVQLRVLAPLADGGAASAGESALRLRWYDAGLPRPQLQIPIVVDGRIVFWLDLGLEELLFAAEYDGEAFHSSDEQVAHDTGRRDWLAQQRAWEIEVFRRGDVYGRHQDADVRLRAAFRAARASVGSRTILL